MNFSPEALRERFAALTQEREAIDAKLNPAWTELNSLVAGDTSLSVREAKAREAALREQIKELQAELYPIEMERATISRALGGKTGVPASQA